MKKYLFIWILTFNSLYSYSQETPEYLINNFFSDFEKAGIKLAITNLYSTNIWLKDNQESMSDVLNKFAPIGNVTIFGKYCGFLQLSEKNTGKTMYAYSYMLKYERQPFRVLFVFYKPIDNWSLYSFSIDDELDDQLKNDIKND
jgi:hypothetical protein